MGGFCYIQFFNLCLQRLTLSDIRENGSPVYLRPILLLELVPLNLITFQIFIFGNCCQAETVLTIHSDGFEHVSYLV